MLNVSIYRDDEEISILRTKSQPPSHPRIGLQVTSRYFRNWRRSGDEQVLRARSPGRCPGGPTRFSVGWHLQPRPRSPLHRTEKLQPLRSQSDLNQLAAECPLHNKSFPFYDNSHYEAFCSVSCHCCHRFCHRSIRAETSHPR